MKTQLLCTFTSKSRLNDTLDIIITCNDVLYEKVYVFQNEKDLGQLICTYNVEYKYYYEESIISSNKKNINNQNIHSFISRSGRPTKIDRRKIDKLMGRN